LIKLQRTTVETFTTDICNLLGERTQCTDQTEDLADYIKKREYKVSLDQHLETGSIIRGNDSGALILALC
jgi:hypothetical protein